MIEKEQEKMGLISSNIRNLSKYSSNHFVIS